MRRLLFAATLLAATVAALAFAEIAVRIRHRIKYGDLWGIEQTYTTDPASGLRIPVPNGSFGGIRINSLGFRGPEIAMPKPARTVRLAFLGSSTTFCAEVSSNDVTWPDLVTKALQARWPEVAFDYVNGGVPGCRVRDSQRNLAYRIARLEPDVILIYDAQNDLAGNSFDLAVQQRLVERHTEQDLSWMSTHSLLWYLIEKNLRVLAQRRTATQVAGKLTVDPQTLVSPFRRDLEQLVSASQKAARLVVLTTFSTQLRPDQSPERQVRAAVTSLYYMPYMSVQGLIDGYRTYNEAIRVVANETGVLLIGDEDSIPADWEHFADTVHFTDAGSRAMATRVVRALSESAVLQEIVRVKQNQP